MKKTNKQTKKHPYSQTVHYILASPWVSLGPKVMKKYNYTMTKFNHNDQGEFLYIFHEKDTTFSGTVCRGRDNHTGMECRNAN